MGYRIAEANDITQTNDVGLGVSLSTGNQLFSPIYETRDQVRENLKTLMLTKIGERYQKPEYGTNLLYVIFEPNLADLKAEITNLIRTPINYWLPDLIIQSIDIVTAEDDPTLTYNIRVTITYSADNYNTDTLTLTADNSSVKIE
jgi:phage baseplate assembly protein W